MGVRTKPKRKQEEEEVTHVAATQKGNFVDKVEHTLARKRVINYSGAVDIAMQHEFAMRLNYLASISKKPITIFMNTPGGVIVDGLAVFDTIKRIGKKVPVNIIANGACMSMGVIILQAATHRACTPNTFFLLHELQGNVQGSLSAQRDDYKFSEELQKRLNKIVTSRSGMTEKQLKKLIERRDFYIDAQEALKFGLVDEIVED
jgi:ATP-dependent Clp protease protease subunit